jgi:hypothetical protein
MNMTTSAALDARHRRAESIFHPGPLDLATASDDFFLPQRGNVRGCVAEFGKHLIGVLAEQRRALDLGGLSLSLIGLPTVRYLPRVG